MFYHKEYAITVLSRGEPRDAAENFDIEFSNGIVRFLSFSTTAWLSCSRMRPSRSGFWLGLWTNLSSSD